jgi:hypothetical protein
VAMNASTSSGAVTFMGMGTYWPCVPMLRVMVCMPS